MVRVTSDWVLSQDEVNLYYTNDVLFANLPVLVFHGPSTTTNSTLNSSRIQVHVFTGAGFQSYPRLTISPSSPFYQSVNHLPHNRQGDEICRGLAFGLLKYFKELPEVVKTGLILQYPKSRSKRPGSAPALFGEQHAADLAASMVKVENIRKVKQDIEAALRPQNINHVDIDLVLPPDSISPLLPPDAETLEADVEDVDVFDPTLQQYGVYAPLVKSFGEVAFLPTSKLRRAPSKATSLSRSKSFLKDQKMSLRREMGELVDTEQRYVTKIHELVNHIADDFRQKAKTRAFGSFSPTDQDLQKLFPQCLDRILRVNSAFLAEIRKVMDDTEEEAMHDLETPLASSKTSRYDGTGRLNDPTGALAFAQVLLEWFPQFYGCYQEYILASQDFPHIITSLTKQTSSFSQRVQQTGEQHLRSAIFEPVQRLPRYSLFIDNIVNYLPITHPALKSMLAARDIITSICSLDPPEIGSQVVQRLRNLVQSWPSTLHPSGRLITAVDFVELPAPFHASPPPHSRHGIILLFAECLIMLRKIGEGNLSARGLTAEIEKPSAAAMMASVTAAAAGQRHIYDLSFAEWHVLGDTRFTVSDDGRCVWMTSVHELQDVSTSLDRNASSPPTIRVFGLQGGYDGKANKLNEEMTKARIEGRFCEKERDTDEWCLRSVKVAAAEVTLHTAVFEDGIDKLVMGRKEPAPVRIVVDHEKGTKGAPIGHYGVEIVANVTRMISGMKYRLEINGLNDKGFVDEVVAEQILPTFVTRAVDLLRVQHHPSNPALTAPFISFHSKILKSLRVATEFDKSRSFRPPSPVKMLSNFLNGGSTSSTTSFGNSGSTFATSKHPKTPLLTSIPSTKPNATRTNSDKNTHSIHDIDNEGSVCARIDSMSNPLVRLEETFSGYIAALQSRKGNVVGKVLRSRGNADELAINALYNTLIESPSDMRAAAEVPVDIVFVAFEKYLRMAWKQQLGQLISLQTLEALQEHALKMRPSDFAHFVKMILSEMAPQNRRAFIAIIRLLADLLEGCGNDGDRGAVTAAFAELLIVDSNPHDYINLLDRMVEDFDTLFDDIGPGAVPGLNGSFDSRYGSVSESRSNHSATGSLTSNASSLRRRFDTLLRQNSNKNETDNRPSVWRTLSKTGRSIGTGEQVAAGSLSKGSLNRSRSIDTSNRRPASHDRPIVMGAFDERPAGSGGQASKLSIISVSPPPTEAKHLRKTIKKNRRSSLSDLKTLLAAAALEGNSTLSSPPERNNKCNSPERTPSPSKLPVAGGIMGRGRLAILETGSPNQKENTSIVSASRNIGNLSERPQNIMSPSDTIVSKDLLSGRGHGKTASISSNIPILRHDRALSSSGPTSPSKTPQKLRLQSPQKLRERLQNEAKAINEAETLLQKELCKIGEEMAELNAGFPSFKQQDIKKLSTTIRALECRIPEVVRGLSAKNDKIKGDLETLLQAAEFKIKSLDRMYKESTAENELLYEKFNGELGKIVKALKGKGKEDKEELVSKLKEANEETAKTKKENARLRKEILALRSLLKGNE